MSISDEDIDNGFADGRTLNVNIDDNPGDDKAVAALKAKVLDSLKSMGLLTVTLLGTPAFH